MRRTNRFGVVLVLLITLIVVIGFGRSWFQVSSTEDATRNEVHVNLTVDRGKIQNDTEKAVDKTKEEAQHVSDSIQRGASNLNERVRDKTQNR
jgi:hypothetical protein